MMCPPSPIARTRCAGLAGALFLAAVAAGSGLHAATIVHRYSFNADNDAGDSVSGNDGVLLNGASVVAGSGGLILPSGPARGPAAPNMGFSALVDIGGNFGTTGVTIEAWFTDGGTGTWGKLFHFGTNEVGQEIAYTNYRGGGHQAPGIDRNGAIQLASYPFGSNTRPALNEEHHLVVAVASDGTTNVWLDGTPEIINAPTNPLGNVVTSTESIGSTAWNDPGHLGSVNEFRIWEGAFTEEEAAASFAAGPDLLPDPGDLDMDGLPDAWEQRWFGNTDQNAGDNPDMDGMTNVQEFDFNANLDPDNPDTDNDGLSDGDEVNVYGTSPLNDDSDSDTLSDGDEILVHNTNPHLADSDGDFYSDALEVANMTDPNDPDDPGLTPPEVVHRYSFTTDAGDSVGSNDGVLIGNAMVAGGQLVLDGSGSYMAFSQPIDFGATFDLTGVTVESWYTDTGSGDWAKLFSFGDAQAGLELAYTHRRGDVDSSAIDRNAHHEFGFEVTTGEEHHLAITVAPDGTTNTWLDGQHVLVDIATNPLSNITATHEYIGESAWTVDPEHLGTVNEFRIYRGMLTDDDVAANLDAGPDVIPDGRPFVITEIDYASGSGEATITWNADPGSTYAVDFATILGGALVWIELDDGTAATGTTASYTDTNIPPGTPFRIYRVRKL